MSSFDPYLSPSPQPTSVNTNSNQEKYDDGNVKEVEDPTERKQRKIIQTHELGVIFTFFIYLFIYFFNSSKQKIQNK